MKNIDCLVSDIDEEILVCGSGANIGGAPCGALWVVIALFVAAEA